jgi:hypothetical protein
MRQFDQYDTAQDEFNQEYLQNVIGAQPVQPAAPAAQPIAQVVSPTAYKPGQTFADYVAAQKAAFVPEAIAATQDSYTGDENRIEFIPGQGAHESTFNESPTASGDYGKWYAAQEKEALKYLPQGWSGGSMGRSQDYTEANGWGEGPEIYLPGTGPTGNWGGDEGFTGVAPNMAYRLKSQDKNGNQVYEVQEYGPNGLVGTPTTVRQGLGDDGLFGLLIQAGMAGVLGPLAGTLGGAVNTGLGLGLGTTGSTALGTALVNAGKTAAMGGDLGDVAKAGLTGGATSYLGSVIGDALPKGVAPTGIKSLDTALTKGMQSAAGSGVTSLLTGNKNILQDALIAGAGAAAGSGANSVISDAAGSTGLPPAALNIIGPAAIAELMGKDPTGAALKAAVGEITGAIKGSSADAKQTTPGVAAPKDLMSGITEPGEYPQDDGSVLSVARPEKGVNAGKLVGNLYSKEDVLKEAYQDWSKQPAYVSPSDEADTFYSGPSVPSDNQELDQIYKDAGLLTATEQPSTDATPKVEVTGQTPDTELIRFLEANGLTSDEAQKVLISGKDQDAGTDYSKFFELGPEGTPTPKVVVQGETPPASSSMDELMSLLSPNDSTQRVEVAGTTPKEPLPTDAGLDLGAYNQGPIVDDGQQVVIKDKLKDEVAPDTQQVLVKDKLVDELPWEDPWIAPKDPDTQEVVIRDKLKDELPWEDPWMPPVVEETFPYIYPGEEPPPEVNEPVVEPVEPVKPVVKPIVDPKRPVTPVSPVTPTDPGASYTIPGTTTQLHQELMQLPETDISRLLNPAFYAYKDAQKRKKLSEEDQMMALLNELGYRS